MKRNAWRGSRMVFVIALSAGLGLAAVSFPRLETFMGVSPPLVGERVPRQFEYRGVLERNGILVQGTQSFSLRLELGDGGVAWSETTVAPVANGNFALTLGDSPTNPIPPAALQDPQLSLVIGVDGQELGRQRILSVAFSNTALNTWQAIGPLRSELDSLASTMQGTQARLSTLENSNPLGVPGIGTAKLSAVTLGADGSVTKVIGQLPTVSHPATGKYVLSFTPSFSAAPICTASIAQPFIAFTMVTPTTNGVTIDVAGYGLTAIDQPISVTCIGG